MKATFKKTINGLLAAGECLLLWLLINTVASIVILILGYLVCAIMGRPMPGLMEMIEHPWYLSFTLFVTDLLVLYVFWKMKYTRYSFNFGYTYGEGFSSKRIYQWAAVSAVGLLLFDLMAGFYLPIPDESEIMESLLRMMRNPVGFVSVCFIGPLAEEVIFRGAIERKLLEKKWNPWCAIVVSALIFAASHLNFAQGFTATVIGVFMGWVYYRTRSIWPCVIIHVVNNTAATLLTLASPETMASEDFEMPMSQGIPLLAVGILIVIVAAYFIGELTKDRTPVPEPVAEVLPPSMTPLDTDTTLPSEDQPLA